jgi:hypothetical protein
MHTLDSYRSTHVELRHMIDDLRAILTVEQLRIRANAKSAYELLCDLGERVRRHLTGSLGFPVAPYHNIINRMQCSVKILWPLP